MDEPLCITHTFHTLQKYLFIKTDMEKYQTEWRQNKLYSLFYG